MMKNIEEFEVINYCPFCGNKISDDINFCPFCGNKIKRELKKQITTIGKISLLISLLLSVFLLIPFDLLVVIIGASLISISLISTIILKLCKINDKLLELSIIILSILEFYLLGYLLIYLTM